MLNFIEAELLYISGLKQLILILLLIFKVNISIADEYISKIISIDDEIDVEIDIYQSNGDKVFIWLACNQGSEGAETRSANVLVKQGIEVWLPDMLSAHFLPPGPSNIFKIPGEEVAAIIDEVVNELPGKSIYLVAGGRSAVPLLRGAYSWEKRNPDKNLAGAIVFFPRLTSLKPEPGKDPVYIDAVGKVRLPVIILEGERTPNRWGLPHLLKQFRKNSGLVHAELLPKVRGYFYVRGDATPAEQEMTLKLPQLLISHLKEFKITP